MRRQYERKFGIRDRAYKLADSGLYDDWQAVERALIEQGFPEAHDALNHDFVRLRLDTACATRKKQNA